MNSDEEKRRYPRGFAGGDCSAPTLSLFPFLGQQLGEHLSHFTLTSVEIEFSINVIHRNLIERTAATGWDREKD